MSNMWGVSGSSSGGASKGHIGSLSALSSASSTISPSTAERSVCKYFLSGGCLKGDQCPFLHELPDERHLDVDGLGFIFNSNVHNPKSAPTGGSQQMQAGAHTPSSNLSHGGGHHNIALYHRHSTTPQQQRGVQGAAQIPSVITSNPLWADAAPFGPGVHTNGSPNSVTNVGRVGNSSGTPKTSANGNTQSNSAIAATHPNSTSIVGNGGISGRNNVKSPTVSVSSGMYPSLGGQQSGSSHNLPNISNNNDIVNSTLGGNSHVVGVGGMSIAPLGQQSGHSIQHGASRGVAIGHSSTGVSAPYSPQGNQGGSVSSPAHRHSSVHINSNNSSTTNNSVINSQHSHSATPLRSGQQYAYRSSVGAAGTNGPNNNSTRASPQNGDSNGPHVPSTTDRAGNSISFNNNSVNSNSSLPGSTRIPQSQSLDFTTNAATLTVAHHAHNTGGSLCLQSAGPLRPKGNFPVRCITPYRPPESQVAYNLPLHLHPAFAVTHDDTYRALSDIVLRSHP